MALRWSEPAVDDVQAIHSYIARDSAAHAERVVRALMRAAEGLARLPYTGHASHDVAGVRERPLARWRYTLIYRVVADLRAETGEADIAIVRVLGPGQQVAATAVQEPS
jgi:plasmid stabilization system protein ParE